VKPPARDIVGEAIRWIEDPAHGPGRRRGWRCYVGRCPHRRKVTDWQAQVLAAFFDSAESRDVVRIGGRVGGRASFTLEVARFIEAQGLAERAAVLRRALPPAWQAREPGGVSAPWPRGPAPEQVIYDELQRGYPADQSRGLMQWSDVAQNGDRL
jgi:hypothetical protein